MRSVTKHTDTRKHCPIKMNQFPVTPPIWSKVSEHQWEHIASILTNRYPALGSYRVSHSRAKWIDSMWKLPCVSYPAMFIRRTQTCLTAACEAKTKPLWWLSQCAVTTSCCVNLLWFNPKVRNYYEKQCATEQAIVEYDLTILHYMHTVNITSQDYSYSLVANVCKVVTVYNGRKLTSVYIKGADIFNCQSLHHYWTQNPRSNLTDIMRQADSHLSIQKSAVNFPINSQGCYHSGIKVSQKPGNSLNTANLINTETDT